MCSNFCHVLKLFVLGISLTCLTWLTCLSLLIAPGASAATIFCSCPVHLLSYAAVLQKLLLLPFKQAPQHKGSLINQGDAEIAKFFYIH